ncbi:6-hydroxy-D-nicotine oxidase [Usitatibacter rugosus]|uniref:6-hydroxy-D-nicotine oxidase n=1 Tax=Usitatibacter rugosus TaxID=2732067 RepID=A0A6M4H124_9PROT|nr:FAD-binding oxidoreductase [Usitatibacter rugosus]QJR12324.1 6-hydroxy-D-nicotine oxidase [Usitatibacter rugosus]
MTDSVSARRTFLARVAAATAAGLAPAFGTEARDGDVAFLERGHPDFERHRALFNKRITLVPASIAVCASEAGVQKAVREAAARRLPVAIKGGGHGFEGFSLNDGGLVVDLAAMNRLALTGEVLVSGPGSRLSQLNDFLLPRSRILPAGSCGGVGLAGLTLGGGYGLFSRRFGLTCDNLTRVRLVDGLGEVRDSRETPEILWACRGGGNGGLGVVTHLEFATHAAPSTLHAFRYRFTVAKAEDAFEVASEWDTLARTLPPEAYSALIANGKTLTILVTTFASRPRSGPTGSVLDRLAARARKVEAPTSLPLAAGVRKYYGEKGPILFKNVSAGFYDRLEDVRPAALALFGAVLQNPGLIYQVNTFGPFPAASDGAFPHRDRRLIGELQAYWDTAARGARLMPVVADLQKQLADAGVRTHYSNYPDVGITDWARAYYGDSYPRLQALKKILDPEDRFRHPQGIRLPEAG